MKNLWSMKWRAPDQEVDQRGLGERLCSTTVKHITKLSTEDAMYHGRLRKLIKYG